MYLFKNRFSIYLLLPVFCIPLFFLNIYDVHSWGDDFAQYIREALNIATGKPYYLSNYIYNPYNPTYAPPQYPPGFPFMLAPIVKIWGVSIRAMCYFNSLIASFLLIALFRFFRGYAGVVSALCLAVIFSYSGFMIDLKRNILSDASCLLFITLYFTARRGKSFGPKKLVILVLLIVAAIQVRSQAILILFAETLFFLLFALVTIFRDKKIRLKSLLSVPSLPVVAGAFILNMLFDKVFFPQPVSTSLFYNNFFKLLTGGNLVQTIEPYFTYLLSTAVSFFHFDTFNGYKHAIMLFIEDAGITFSVVGFVVKARKDPGVGEVFFMIMCFVILLFPGRDARYFLPAVPFLFLYAFIGLRTILPSLVNTDHRIIAVFFTLVYFWAGAGYLKRTLKEVVPGCVPQEKELAAFSYINSHVDEKDVIVFTKPRFLTLYTNKRCVNVAWQISPEMNKKFFDSLNVKYMLVVDGLDDGYFKDYLRNTQLPIDSARIAQGYMLYTLR